MKNVLITGGLGYIGQNLCDYLKTKGVDYEIVDSKIHYDVLEIEDTWRYDGIVHLAAVSGIIDVDADPEKAIETNITSTLHIMQEACKYSKPLVFASSGAAPTPYESLYAMSKWIGEVEAKRLNRYMGKNHVLRFSNVYGGKYWEEKPSVIPVFQRLKAEGKELIINGTGEQKRDFIHVFDICRAIWKALNTERIISLPIPICTGETTSIWEIAKKMKCKFTFDPDSDIVGVDNVFTETQLAKDILGFENKENLNDYFID